MVLSKFNIKVFHCLSFTLQVLPVAVSTLVCRQNSSSADLLCSAMTIHKSVIALAISKSLILKPHAMLTPPLWVC